MALLDDVTTLALLASAAFFVALSVGLLVRYRQVSEKINASSDLGHGLWSALEQRMKKQDERILDVMGRLEVVQSRVMAATSTRVPVTLSPLPPLSPPPAPSEERPSGASQPAPGVQQPESHSESRMSQRPPSQVAIDETQLTAIKLLSESPKNTRQLTDALKKSREHTARLMKGLFEMGLVGRNDSTKPFVYQLTDAGRHYLAGN